MCDFAEPWFGASYPDSMCIDGYLHDADADGYFPDDVSHPCPRCNTREYLVGRREEAESISELSWWTPGGGRTITGHDIWEIAKAWSRQENPADAEPIIVELELRPNAPLGVLESTP